MRSFHARDLAQLDATVLARARAVVAMREIHAGARAADVIGLRHDVDDNPGALATAVKLAGWEAVRGYRSTYFILHGARYWRDERTLRPALEAIAAAGHEIGIHANALALALRAGGDPSEILHAAIERLRGYGFPVVGVAPHGDKACHRAGFVNDELFADCARPQLGAPDRTLTLDGRTVKLAPQPLTDFGLLYETYRLPHGRYLSDSGGAWNVPLQSIADKPGQPGQLHILQHPDWWSQVFTG
ncbi:MAG TPA: hypothetical protein VFO24_07555 [Usitatibacter sp.]|nr:hypothetical protein [Usitatibacter sp.]